MQKVSFYLENGAILDVNLSQPQLGNPGCGGTEYATASLVFELSKQNLFQITVYSQSKFSLPNVENILVENLIDALDVASKRRDIFIFRAYVRPDISFLKKLRESSVSAIVWLHVTPNFENIAELARIEQVKALVTMSQRQFYNFLDSSVSKKTINIMNGQYPSRLSRNQECGQTVTYLGALVEQKGFHLLADVWPNILRKVPEATLKVVGSGELYNRGNKLGPLGLAGADYEDLIITNFGNSIHSVQFMGRVSNIEKDRIIANSALGVVNPSGLGENCPASVLDFQSAGVPVVTAKRNGLIDTVLDGVTGRLVISQRQLEEAIVELLQDTQLNKKYSDAGPIFVGEKFNFVSICESWKGLIYSIQGRLELPSQDVPSPIGFKENLILLNYKLGNSINRNNLLPSYARLDSILRRFLRLMLKRNS